MQSPQEIVTIPASWQSLARTALIVDVLLAAGLFEMLGPGLPLVLACSVAVVVSALLVLPAVRGTHRLELGPEGFTSYNAFGRIAQKRAWEDVEGHFQIVKMGWNDAIAYQLSAACKTPGKKSRLPQGFDEAIPSLYRMTAVQLALLLNERKRDRSPSRRSP
jgi:hypothetical protein